MADEEKQPTPSGLLIGLKLLCRGCKNELRSFTGQFLSNSHVSINVTPCTTCIEKKAKEIVMRATDAAIKDSKLDTW